MSITENLAATHLGKTSKGSEQYDKSLLVAIPRSENREQYSIDENNLPFIGFDIWNAYEVSFITTNNIPVTGVLKIKYPSNSRCIVESKSLKLYLNSFNMTPLKETRQSSLDYFLDCVKTDLSELLETNVEVFFHSKFTSTESDMFKDYTPIEDLVDMDNIKCNNFTESPELLIVENGPVDVKFSFGGLRSNCRVTGQPDFGDLFVHIKADRSISLESIVQYMVSFRKENHFHEEVLEMIYKRLMDQLDPEELMVAALFSRRGGADISPIRANKEELLDKELLDISRHTRRTVKQ